MSADSKHTGSFARWLTPAATVFLFAAFCLLILNYNKTDPGEIALREGTLPKENTTLDGHNIRNDIEPDPEEWDYWKDLLPGRDEAGALIVWIGNSHLHAINGLQPGDQVSSYYLHVLLNGETWPGDTPCFGLSYPNLHFIEQFLLTLWLMESADLPGDLVIVTGYRYHETRNKGVRSELKPMLHDPVIREWINEHHELETEFPDAFRELRSEMTHDPAAGKDEKDIETMLREAVWDRLPVFSRRGDINANLRLMLARLRKFVFRIDTSTKRGVLLSRYVTSMDFMELAARAAAETGTRMLMYNVPLRPGVDSPFPEKEYRMYVEDMERIAAEAGPDVAFRDYDPVIPQPDWGTFYTSGQPDYSHFKASGHRILAEAVARDLRKLGFIGGEDVE